MSTKFKLAVFFLAVASHLISVASADDNVIFNPRSTAAPSEVLELENVGPSAELDGAAQQDDDAPKESWYWARITGGVMVTIPVLDFEGFAGVQLINGALEFGAELGAMPVVALLYGGGAYVKIAPVPVGIGKRFYLSMHGRRFWVADSSAGVDHIDSVSLNLGYTDHLDQDDTENMSWFVEAGVVHMKKAMRDPAEKDEVSYLPSVTAGVRY